MTELLILIIIIIFVVVVIIIIVSTLQTEKQEKDSLSFQPWSGFMWSFAKHTVRTKIKTFHPSGIAEMSLSPEF